MIFEEDALFYPDGMRALMILALALAGAAVATPAVAQGSKPSGEIHRDPKGVSPYHQELAKGRKAVQAKNLDGAASAFESAIAKDPTQMHGYLLLAQVHLAKGDLDGALETAEKGRSKAGSDDVKSKLLFLRSDLLERKHNSAPGADNAPGSPLDAIAKKWEEAKVGWADYSAFLTSLSGGAEDHRASAEERVKRIEDRVKRDNDYAAVRKRILDGEKDLGK